MSADRIVFAAAVFGWAFLIGHMSGSAQPETCKPIPQQLVRKS